MSTLSHNHKSAARQTATIVCLVLTVIFLSILLVLSFMSYAELPVAVFSNSSGECVRIITEDAVKSPCGKLPERYHMEWTK